MLYSINFYKVKNISEIEPNMIRKYSVSKFIFVSFAEFITRHAVTLDVFRRRAASDTVLPS